MRTTPINSSLYFLKLIFAFLLVSSFLFLLTGDTASFDADSKSPAIATNYYKENAKVDINYFYFNPCASCDVESEFLIRLDTLLGIKKDYINLRMYNAFYESVSEKLLDFYELYDVSENNRTPPILFIGDTYIQGSTNIDLKLADAFDKAKQAALNSSLEKQTINNSLPESEEFAVDLNVMQNSTLRSRIVYFYLPLCADCTVVESFFETLDRSYVVLIDGKSVDSYVQIKKYDISDVQNLSLIRQYFREYNVPEDDQKVPVLFIGDAYLHGANDIRDYLVGYIRSGYGLSTTVFLEASPYNLTTESSMSTFDFAGIVTVGLINGFNPCSLSMLLFLLSTAISKGIITIKLGLSFILGRFVTYLLLGTVFFNLLTNINTATMGSVELLVRIILITATLFLVVYNIRDYIAAKNEKYSNIKLQLPLALRRKNHEWIKKFMSVKNPHLLMATTFILGILISIGEFLCTGQIYILSIIYIMQVADQLDLTTTLSFIVYCLALILPMLVLLILIHKGKEIFEVSELLRRKLHFIKLLNAFVFLVFALIVVFVI